MLIPPPSESSSAPVLAKPRVDVICRGTPREMGLAQGAALRAEVHDALATLARLEAFRLLQSWWLPYGVFRRFAQWRAKGFLSPALARSSGDLSERLAGIAEGANVGTGELFLLNALEAVMSDVQGSSTVAPLGCCSALAVRGRRTPTGEPVIVRNFDYLPIIQPLYALRESRPAGRLRSLEFTAAPLSGAVDGVNERGLCVTYNYAHVTDAAVPAPTISMNISQVLGRCSTVKQAIDLFAALPRWGGGMLMLADAEGDLASLELSNTQSEVRRPQAGEDLVFHTNTFQTASMKQVEIDRRAVFNKKAPTVLRGRRVLQSADARDRRFEECLPGFECFGPDELLTMMSDHGDAGVADDDTICMHGSYWRTTACLQLFPRSRMMRVAYGPACGAEFEEIAFG
jgi:hypothetical protein